MYFDTKILTIKFLPTYILLLFGLLLKGQTLDIELFANGLNKPVDIQHAGDNRLFVVELDGYIKIIENDGSLLNQPFLDIDDKVKNISGISEQGFLGLAFHPDYSDNGYFYVNYINNENNTVISRFSRSSENQADPSSEVVLLTINQPFSNHNGGNIRFGPDGYLYIASGDGGSGGDPQNNAQNLGNLLGKILRLDVDNPSAGLNYGIPPDNPFINNSTARDEIWAYGLRNPWKFSFDRLNGDLWIGDVGQNNFEEVNLIESSDAAINFGWRCYEGDNNFNLSGCADQSSFTFPVGTYVNGTRCAITGGFRYRGSEFPNFQGKYFFADYCSGELGILTETSSAWNLEFADSYPGNNWSSFGEDNNGELYVAGIISGSIFKIVDSEVLDVYDYSTQSIRLYPNPVINRLQIDLDFYNRGLTKFKILDSMGRSVSDFSIRIEEKITIDVDKLASGFYILKLKTEDSKWSSHKFLKL